MGVKPLNFTGLRTLGAAAQAAALLGCSHSPPPPAAAVAAPGPCPSREPLRLNLLATAHLNPSERGEPMATVVRVYQPKGICPRPRLPFA